MAKKSIDLKSFTKKLNSLLQMAVHYQKLLLMLVVVAMYGFLIYRINSLAGIEPSDSAVAEKLQSVQRPRIDKNVVKKIQQLQDNSSEVRSIFQAARDNPFNE